MAIDSNQRPTLREGGTHLIRIDLRNDLDEDDTVSSGSVEELSTDDLTLGSVTVTSEETIVEHQNVPAGQAVEFTVSGHLAASSPYRLKLTFSTAGGVANKSPKEDFVFDVVE